jgi:general secretion pathway protein B
MSFILDALKKSENERQRKIGPSLADVQVRGRSSEKPWWAFAVGGLLLVNLTVLVIVLVRNDDSATQASSPVIQQQAPATAQPPGRAVTTTTPPATRTEVHVEAQSAPIAPAGSRDPSVRSLADEATVDSGAQAYPPENPELAAAAGVPDGPAIVRPIQAPSVSPSAGPAPQPRPRPAEEPQEVLPTFRELGGTATNLPELHLDIHVHSPMPAERFVFVNMRKYIEGQSLSEGPSVERITADGVILNHRGLRFLLPRQ